MMRYISDAARCRRNGWKRGTRLIGWEGYAALVIEITAVGEDLVLAKPIKDRGHLVDNSEEVFALNLRRRRRWKP